MDATEVIDSYVHDVARRLPPGQRNDVAFELRALLADDLRARAEAEGRSPDQQMAVAMVREFGRPAAVAVSYYRPFTIIEPSDTWSFLVAAIAGGTLASLLVSLGHGSAPSHEPTQLANAAFLAWLGALVVVFGVKNLILRYRPSAFAWTPRPVRYTDSVSRAGAVGLALVWLALLACYLVPGRLAELVSGGRGRRWHAGLQRLVHERPSDAVANRTAGDRRRASARGRRARALATQHALGEDRRDRAGQSRTLPTPAAPVS